MTKYLLIIWLLGSTADIPVQINHGYPSHRDCDAAGVQWRVQAKEAGYLKPGYACIYAPDQAILGPTEPKTQLEKAVPLGRR